MPELILMPYPAFSYIRFVKKERPLVSKSEHKDVLFFGLGCTPCFNPHPYVRGDSNIPKAKWL